MKQTEAKQPNFIVSDECPECGETLNRINRTFLEDDGELVSHCKDCAFEMIYHKIMTEETVENLETFFHVIHRSHYPIYLLRHFLFITKNCPDLFAELWIDSEGVYANLKIWKLWFKYIKDNRIKIMTKENKKAYDRLPDEFTIYRGSVCENGISWTLNKEKAEWFRDRFATFEDNVQLFERKVKKIDIVAYFGDRGEDEIIFIPDTENLPNLLNADGLKLTGLMFDF